MKSLICKIFGHIPITNKKRCWCKRCGKEGFMDIVDNGLGRLIEYEFFKGGKK